MTSFRILKVQIYRDLQQRCLEARVGGSTYTEWKDNHLYFQTAERTWEEVSYSWSGTCSGYLCIENLASLSVWSALSDIYGSQKPEVPVHAKGIEHETMTMADTGKWLWLWNFVPSRESESSYRYS